MSNLTALGSDWEKRHQARALASSGLGAMLAAASDRTETPEARLQRLQAWARQADDELEALEPTAAQLRKEAAEAERLAFETGGASAKTSMPVLALMNKWETFVDVHGDAYGFEGAPTVDLAVHFVTHGFKERQNYSPTGAMGMSDSWGERVVPYLLAKFVFPMMKYPGWVGLGAHALTEKQKPYSIELRKQWQSLKHSHVRSVAC